MTLRSTQVAGTRFHTNPAGHESPPLFSKNGKGKDGKKNRMPQPLQCGAKSLRAEINKLELQLKQMEKSPGFSKRKYSTGIREVRAQLKRLRGNKIV